MITITTLWIAALRYCCSSWPAACERYIAPFGVRSSWPRYRWASSRRSRRGARSAWSRAASSGLRPRWCATGDACGCSEDRQPSPVAEQKL